MWWSFLVREVRGAGLRATTVFSRERVCNRFLVVNKWKLYFQMSDADGLDFCDVLLFSPFFSWYLSRTVAAQFAEVDDVPKGGPAANG